MTYIVQNVPQRKRRQNTPECIIYLCKYLPSFHKICKTIQYLEYAILTHNIMFYLVQTFSGATRNAYLPG